MTSKEIKLGVSLGQTKNVPKYYLIHCTDVSYTKNKDQFQATNNYHRDVRQFYESEVYKGNFVGYHRLFTGGKEYKCKEDWEVGCHCNQGYDGVKVYPPGTQGKLSVNYQSIGGCVAFDGDIEEMPLIEKGLLQKHIWEMQDKYQILDKNVLFHRFFTGISKTCPGSLLDEQWLATLLIRPVETPIPPKPIDRTCVAQEAEIKQLKERLKWYEIVLNFFFGNRTV